MATPTNAYINSGSWSFSVGGTTYSLIRIKDWSLNRGVSRIRDSADYDHFYTISANDFEDPSVHLQTSDAISNQLIPAGAIGTLTGVIRDAQNGVAAGGGAKQITLENASMMDAQSSGAHRQISRGSIGFCSFSLDGITNPLTISAL